MATILNADTVTGGAIITGDASGELALQAAGTTKLTVAAGGVTLAQPLPAGSGGTGLTSPGTSGNVLTSNGTAWTSSAPATPTFNIRSDVSYSDAAITIGSTLGTSGTFGQSVTLTATTELLLIYGDSSLHAVVWDNTAKTFGSPVLVRTANLSSQNRVTAIAISSTAVLVCSLPSGTALQTVVLSVSGSTITVNTPVSTTLAAASELSFGAPGRLLQFGTSYVLSYYTTADGLPKFRAITVSGTTPTVGTQLAVAAGSSSNYHLQFAYTSSVLLHISGDGTTLYAVPISVSGTTLTQGTQATRATNALNIVGCLLSTGRVAIAHGSSSTTGVIVSVAGTTATLSTGVSLLSGFIQSGNAQAIGDTVFFLINDVPNGYFAINRLRDNAGTAVAGTALTTYNNSVLCGYNATSVFVGFNSGTSTAGSFAVYGSSGNNAVVTAQFPSTLLSYSSEGGSPQPKIAYSNASSTGPYANIENQLILRTTANKHVAMNQTQDFIVNSFDGTVPPQLQAGFSISPGSVNQFAININRFRSALSLAAGWYVAYANDLNTTVRLRRVELS